MRRMNFPNPEMMGGGGTGRRGALGAVGGCMGDRRVRGGSAEEKGWNDAVTSDGAPQTAAGYWSGNLPKRGGLDGKPYGQ